MNDFQSRISDNEEERDINVINDSSDFKLEFNNKDASAIKAKKNSY